jgi:glucose/mannose-6-phosphate isomerase
MDLNDYQSFPNLDPQDMLGQIDRLPNQLESAWELGAGLPLSPMEGIQQVLIAGMGGSAIGADLLAACVSPNCRAPILVHRDYGLPAWARGPRTLVVASSHSGNTEETLTTFDEAVRAGCQGLAISTGGKLAERARDHGIDLWTFDHAGQPRAAVGFSFGLLLAAFARLGLIPDPSTHLKEAVEAMRAQQTKLKAVIPVVQNPAKRLAGQFMGRWVTIFGAEVLAPVARRWKGQLNELAKAWGQFDFIPEADHNTLAGILHPEELLSRMMAVFLRASSEHPRNRLRGDLTRRALMVEGINTDFIDAQGDNPMAQQWTALHYGDYTSYYLAMAYEMDPTPVEAIQGFKREMEAAGS